MCPEPTYDHHVSSFRNRAAQFVTPRNVVHDVVWLLGFRDSTRRHDDAQICTCELEAKTCRLHHVMPHHILPTTHTVTRCLTVSSTFHTTATMTIPSLMLLGLTAARCPLHHLVDTLLPKRMFQFTNRGTTVSHESVSVHPMGGIIQYIVRTADSMLLLCCCYFCVVAVVTPATPDSPTLSLYTSILV